MVKEDGESCWRERQGAMRDGGDLVGRNTTTLDVVSGLCLAIGSLNQHRSHFAREPSVCRRIKVRVVTAILPSFIGTEPMRSLDLVAAAAGSRHTPMTRQTWP